MRGQQAFLSNDCRCGATTYMYTLNICMLRNTKAAVLPAMSAQSRQSPCKTGAYEVRPIAVIEACMQQATASTSGSCKSCSPLQKVSHPLLGHHCIVKEVRSILEC